MRARPGAISGSLRDVVRKPLRLLVVLAAVGVAAVGYLYLLLPDVGELATVNPTTTAFMELREREATAAGQPVRRSHRWVRYSQISPYVTRAVLVAEDSAFWQHEGIDLEQIRQSIEDSIRSRQAPRGASTITQQLAKNLYLSPSRNPLRKLQELIIARRLEAALSKTRILEIYLNVIEWGDQIWGIEAASRAYFGVPASSVTRSQAALLAGAIINPRAHNPARPSRRLLRRQEIILGRMGDVEPASSVPREPTAPLIEPELLVPYLPPDEGSADVPPADSDGLPPCEDDPQPEAECS